MFLHPEFSVTRGSKLCAFKIPAIVRYLTQSLNLGYYEILT